MSERIEYSLRLTVNDRVITRVIIDQHYRLKHAESVNDELILNLVKTLDGSTVPVEAESSEFQYFSVEPVVHAEAPYRLVLVMCLTDDYLGVINAFRVKRNKK